MPISSYVAIGYAIFLFIILVINLLYFFEIFKYRLPNDASLPILGIYLALILLVLIGTTVLAL